jgi:hypothetical protein
MAVSVHLEPGACFHAATGKAGGTGERFQVVSVFRDVGYEHIFIVEILAYRTL